MKTVLTTIELLDISHLNESRYIEAALLLNYNGKATHFISTKKSQVFDEGIDSDLVKWKKEEFISNYENGQWVIEQIV